MLNKPFRVKIYKYKLRRKIYIRSEAAKCCLRHPKAEYKGNMDALSSAEILVFNTHEIMIPLSIEKLSDGRPAMVHERIFTGSPREFIRDMLGEHGISLLLQRFIHSSVWSCRGVHSLVMTSFSPDYYEHLNCKDSCKRSLKTITWHMAWQSGLKGKTITHSLYCILFSSFTMALCVPKMTFKDWLGFRDMWGSAQGKSKVPGYLQSVYFQPNWSQAFGLYWPKNSVCICIGHRVLNRNNSLI